LGRAAAFAFRALVSNLESKILETGYGGPAGRKKRDLPVASAVSGK
jgi:hypothetical protein